MFEQIAQDAAAGRFDAWALSTVVDETVGAPVIDREDFTRLHEAAGLTADWPIGNAGLIHVYGYLLSTVQTPYGLKRDRWLDGSLATALGRHPRAFLLEDADAAGETVLQRVTDALLPHLEAAASEQLLRIDHRAVDGTVFRTVVIDGALIYGVVLGDRVRAVTAFPVTVNEGFLDRLLGEPPRMRYNAATTNLPPRSVLG